MLICRSQKDNERSCLTGVYIHVYLTQGPGSPIIKIKIPDSEGIILGSHIGNYILFANWKPIPFILPKIGSTYLPTIRKQSNQKQQLYQFQFEISPGDVVTCYSPSFRI